jgi:hypothetical protein
MLQLEAYKTIYLTFPYVVIQINVNSSVNEILKL